MTELLSEDTGSVWRVTKGCKGGVGGAAGKRVAWESGRQIAFPWAGAPNSSMCVPLSEGLRPEGPTGRTWSLPERKAIQKETRWLFIRGEKEPSRLPVSFGPPAPAPLCTQPLAVSFPFCIYPAGSPASASPSSFLSSLQPSFSNPQL